MSTEARYVGLMSGTSVDGIDAVVAEFGPAPRLLATAAQEIPDALRQQLIALNAPQFDDLRLANESSVALAHLYAKAVGTVLNQAGLAARDVRAIGCHGQTVRHRPERGYTVQLNQPALLAELCGIDVVADFRSRDVAAGGQGAPLLPAFHAQVLRSANEHRAVLNLGGIANLTNLPSHGAVTGFDTGPANVLLDSWMSRHRGLAYDADGAWAAGGQVIPGLLQTWLGHPFFKERPPKSCGREEFSLAWVDQALTGHEAPRDVQATLLELTAVSIADALHQHCGAPTRLILCGGGMHNSRLRERLATLLPTLTIACSDDYDVPGDWLEAFAFAWFAHCALARIPANLPEVTGAKGPRILGAVYPA